MIGPILNRLTLSIQKTRACISDITWGFAVIEMKPRDKNGMAVVLKHVIRKRLC